jgi:hypothetical protein
MREQIEPLQPATGRRVLAHAAFGGWVDVGGFAWDNTELGTDVWLWYNFLRTGAADAFHMAEAMTRHTTEVNVYHLGPWEGLGSRQW